MKKRPATDALTLSVQERIQLVEDVLDTIAIEAMAIELTADEEKIVDERLGTFSIKTLN